MASINITSLSKAYSIEGRNERYTVLKNFNASIHQGEVLSLVGSNGSGKSTLLGILSGLIKPDSGEIVIEGSLVSILENGSNFHQELNGRENAEMFFQLNGVEQSRIPDLVIKVKEFSGLGDYFEEGIKYYSQGMFIRLAVSVAFHIDADIYLFDEIMSVGDDAFKKKIEIVISNFINKGKIIVFASHNKQEVVNYSTRTIWLEQGNLKMDDKPQKVMLDYGKFQRLRFEKDLDESDLKNPQAMLFPEEDEDGLDVAFESGQFGNEFLELRAVRVFGKGYNRQLFREEPIHFEFRLKKKKPDFRLSCLIKVKDEFEQPVFFSLSLSNQTKLDLGKDTENYSGELTYQVSLPSRFLASGTYFLTLFFGKESERGHVYSERAFLFPRTIVFRVQVSEEEFVSDPEHFSVNPAFEWHVKKN